MSLAEFHDLVTDSIPDIDHAATGVDVKNDDLPGSEFVGMLADLADFNLAELLPDCTSERQHKDAARKIADLLCCWRRLWGLFNRLQVG